MEKTFLDHTCRSANIRAIMRDPAIRDTISELLRSYQGLESEDRRGTRLHEQSVLSSVGTADPFPTIGKGSLVSLGAAIFSALVATLNAEVGYERYIDVETLIRRPKVVYMRNRATVFTKIAFRGVTYGTTTTSPANSNILFTTADGTCAGRITSIFCHTRMEMRSPGEVEETFVVVERLKELSEEDSKRDPYRQFPHVGGQLYCNEYIAAPIILRPNQIRCHVAKTVLDEGLGFDFPCAHILPLERVGAFLYWALICSNSGDPI